MASFMLPIIFVLIFSGFIYKFGSQIQKAFEWILSIFLAFPKGFGGQILPAFLRVSKLNWYTLLMLLLVYVVLFNTPFGKDMIIAFIENLKTFQNKRLVFGAFLSLFGCTFFLSIAIWILPFYLYSPARREEITKNFKRYYLATKLLAFLAMGPFVILTNAFIYHLEGKDSPINMWYLLAINLGVFLTFTLMVFVLRKKLIPNIFSPINKFLSERIANGYIIIFIKILAWILLLTLIFPLFINEESTDKSLAIYVFIYMLIASFLVFRIFFYSSEDSEDSEAEIERLVIGMINPETTKYSKFMYRFIFWSLIAINLYYYLVPSLEPTNTLYILLIVFAFFIIYLDYFRNLYSNRTGLKRILAFFGTALFLASPFLTSKNQFRISYHKMADTNLPQPTLEEALIARCRVIKETTKQDTVYIVCGMGGGSRAGYITAGVLYGLDTSTTSNTPGVEKNDTLKESESSLWDRTLCYSTISGGSVGTYQYIKGKVAGKLPKDTSFLPFLYRKNYNSSGVFGLFLGDPIETIFGSVAVFVRTLVTGEKPPLGYFDRNYRIRKEYDYILNQALKDSNNHKENLSYLGRSFYARKMKDSPPPDSYKAFFIKHQNTIPIHLVNTFKVNTGRKAVLSPFTLADTNFFPNSVLPLQDTDFDDCAPHKDIYYREAVNLSELFPLVSAASHLGQEPYAQFVDGGYFENYGLSTALDVFYYLDTSRVFKDSLNMHVKILLIKNSKQEAKYSNRNIQVLAPLIGAMNSPFTGHANHLQAVAGRDLKQGNFYAITFDADSMKVPLTRALNRNHIDSMNKFIKTLPYDTALNRFLNRTR